MAEASTLGVSFFVWYASNPGVRLRLKRSSSLKFYLNCKFLTIFVMLGDLNAIATLELFTQNYFKYGRISFTMRQRIKF